MPTNNKCFVYFCPFHVTVGDRIIDTHAQVLIYNNYNTCMTCYIFYILSVSIAFDSLCSACSLLKAF